MTARRFILESVSSGLTINSKGCATDEYGLRFEDGAAGRGSAPLGETRSCYEAEAGGIDNRSVVHVLTADGILGREFSQAEFDQYLAGKGARIGPSAVYALSCAFFEAALESSGRRNHPGGIRPPRFCLNILNGGRHAYTNPVLSDFHEYLLLPKHADIALLLDDHRSIQDRVRSQLSATETTRVSGNTVHVLGGQGNRDCIEFLLGILDDLGLYRRYGLMIDAAAAQLWNGSAYALDLAEKRELSPGELEDYWTGIIADYPVALLEDPFAEHDLERWTSLAATAAGCIIAGDDVHSGDPGRVSQLLDSGCMNGMVLKPDQAGTISATLEAVEVARAAGVPVILSHRSISTDSLVLAHLMVDCGIELAKFGPLLTDFSSVLKMNEVLRMTRGGHVVGPVESDVENAPRDLHAGA
jgi:enolase